MTGAGSLGNYKFGSACLTSGAIYTELTANAADHGLSLVH